MEVKKLEGKNRKWMKVKMNNGWERQREIRRVKESKRKKGIMGSKGRNGEGVLTE